MARVAALPIIQTCQFFAHVLDFRLNSRPGRFAAQSDLHLSHPAVNSFFTDSGQVGEMIGV